MKAKAHFSYNINLILMMRSDDRTEFFIAAHHCGDIDTQVRSFRNDCKNCERNEYSYTRLGSQFHCIFTQQHHRVLQTNVSYTQTSWNRAINGFFAH